MGSGTVNGTVVHQRNLDLVRQESHAHCVMCQPMKPILSRTVCVHAATCITTVWVCYFSQKITKYACSMWRQRDSQSSREDVRNLQTISLSCWCNRHIFQDVAACGPRLCLSRMTPFTFIHQRPTRPPLTLDLPVCVCVWQMKKGQVWKGMMECSWLSFLGWYLMRVFGWVCMSLL